MSIAPYIDHTLLKSSCHLKEIEILCAEARQYNFKTVCVPPYFVANAKHFLSDSNVDITTVIGFPFGYSHFNSKFKETLQAIDDGADELDMVMNIAAFKNNDLTYLESEINCITQLIKKENKVIKVIIETALLSEEEIVKCCNFYSQFPIQFLKTSTGYAEKGASIEVVQLMKKNLPDSIQVKASGGIKTYDFARQLLNAGATRLGCSASVAIIKNEIADYSSY